VQAGDLPYLAAFGVVQLAGGLLFFTLASRVVPAGELSLLMLIETVAGPIWAWLGVGEAPAGLALGGALVVLAATTINAGFALRRTPVAAAATQAGLPKPR
jgi:drug/metabolite transporter (DMT)-like permease